MAPKSTRTPSAFHRSSQGELRSPKDVNDAAFDSNAAAVTGASHADYGEDTLHGATEINFGVADSKDCLH
jgi:hypothetical protein